jgi:hypothetical protein
MNTLAQLDIEDSLNALLDSLLGFLNNFLNVFFMMLADFFAGITISF